MALKNGKDHWAFLEEFEAPMWADLTLEANSNYHEIDDSWFHASHRFHYCSSKELKALFASFGEGSNSAEFELKGPSSPKLPSSVSRSRGKHYASKKWRGYKNHLLLDKQHPVKRLNMKPSTSDSGSAQKMKAKVSFIDPKETSRSEKSSLSERDSARYSKEKRAQDRSVSGVGASSSSSVVHTKGESYASTITYESEKMPNQSKMEVSSGSFGRKSGLLSAVRTSLSKKCATVTRKASRVEINNNRRQTRDRKSLSGKSSVGSSATPAYEVKDTKYTLVKKKEQISNGRTVIKMTESAKNKVQDPKTLKASSGSAKVGMHNSRKGSIDNIAKLTHKEVTKVQKQNVGTKALMPHGSNNQCSSAALKPKGKVAVVKTNRLIGAFKENLPGTKFFNQKESTGDDAAKGQMVTKLNAPKKGDRTFLDISKGKVKSPSKRQNPATLKQRTFFR